eukprot:TRINITY_DN5109_c0_g1_i1.p1 TRINITY_DN5109_c0_g1~~TRINITY_DN5109_c0_g1_i1.p1  ORF type:complete len:870 (-),score=194.51 TRINITY_DN5109_c0_g1_i1:348-2957(-)
MFAFIFLCSVVSLIAFLAFNYLKKQELVTEKEEAQQEENPSQDEVTQQPEFFMGLLNYEEFGLLVRKTRDSFPLKHFKVEAQVLDVFSEVTITQTFGNFPEATEAIYAFPNKETAITSFELKTQDRDKFISIKAMEKAGVQQSFGDFLQEEMGSYVGDLKEEELFQLTLGELPAEKEITVTIKYVKQLTPVEGFKLSFVVPEQLFPRASWCPYSFHGSFWNGAGIKKLECVSHPSITSQPVGSDGSAVLQFQKETSMGDREIRVVLTPRDSNTASCLMEEDPVEGTCAAIVTYCPLWESDKRIFDVKSEIIFLVDRSISMKGPNFETARSILQLFLRNIQADNLFNIVGYGNRSHFLFSESKAYDDNTLKLATEYVKKMQPDLGGSEIYRPLTSILSSSYNSQYPRHIFILTDGQVYDRDKVIELVKSATDYTRVFSIGVGDDADVSLIKALAEAGNGECEFISKSDSVDKSLQLLGKVMEPKFSQVKINWTSLGETTQAPYRVPPVFHNKRLVVFGLIKSNGSRPESLSIEGYGPESQVNAVNAKITWRKGQQIHKLTSYSLIRKLQEGTTELHTIHKARSAQLERAEKAAYDNQLEAMVKERALFLSKKYQLPSKYTSFVTLTTSSSDIPEQIQNSDVVGLQFYQQDALRPIEVDLSRSLITRRYSIAKTRRSSVSSFTEYQSGSSVRATLSRSIEIPKQLTDTVAPNVVIKNKQWLTVEDVILLQSANGRWTSAFLLHFNQIFRTNQQQQLKAFGLSEEDGKNTDVEQMISTALAITFLKTFYSSKKNEWSLVVAKGERWISLVQAKYENLKNINPLESANSYIATLNVTPQVAFQTYMEKTKLILVFVWEVLKQLTKSKPKSKQD